MEHLDAHSLPGACGPEGQPEVAFQKRRLHALHRCGLREGLPIGGAQLHGIRQRRVEGRALHRLQELCGGLPLQVPKYDGSKDQIYKCDLCQTRLQADRPPACVLSCPTGALTIGDKDAMIKTAAKRVKELGGDASVYGDRFVGGTHVIYVLTEKAEVYDNLPEPEGASVDHCLEGRLETGRSAGGGRRCGGLVPPLHHPRSQDSR